MKYRASYASRFMASWSIIWQKSPKMQGFVLVTKLFDVEEEYDIVVAECR